MDYYKIQMKAKSPFSELFTADQIWGQIVWAISDMKGTQRADSFVKEFLDSPPFLLSMMMPEGLLPIPILPPVLRDVSEGDNKAESEARKRTKKNKKCKWLTLEQFLQLQSNSSCFAEMDLDLRFQHIPGQTQETKVSIDRFTNSQIDGSLHSLTYEFSDCPFVIYLAIDPERPDILEELGPILDFLSKVGIGGDRSVGRGIFDMKMVQVSDTEQSLFSFDQVNTFMTLSRCFGRDLVPLSYRVSAYSGIVGRSLEGRGNVQLFNKKPILGYDEGSVFSAGRGGLATGIHPDPRVCSYGYAFPIPIRLEESR
ncbi:MAG: RAMP superfamily CRISPR-associated protein [Sphaerochaeta sp.]